MGLADVAGGINTKDVNLDFNEGPNPMCIADMDKIKTMDDMLLAIKLLMRVVNPRAGKKEMEAEGFSSITTEIPETETRAFLNDLARKDKADKEGGE